jgi:ABC-2 type transport system permease protein
MRGLAKLTWLEIKIFAREPLGLIGSVLMPVLIFVVVGRMLGTRGPTPPRITGFLVAGLPVFATIMMALSAVLSLITVIAIYREGGILKRLRATPLSPVTILTAHVLVKLLFTLVTLALLVAAGKRYYPVGIQPPLVGFTAALLLSTLSILSIGFVIASVVPTARFAQPVGTVILYPMLALCGLFIPIAAMPPALRAAARLLPLTYAASLLTGIWTGDPWSAHAIDVVALVGFFAVFTAISARVFRWE